MNRLFYILSFSLFLYACGGGGGSGNSSTQNTTTTTLGTTTTTLGTTTTTLGTTTTTLGTTTTTLGTTTTTTILPKPIANAGADQVVVIGSTVSLSGIQSQNATNFQWFMQNKPLGSKAIIVNWNTSTPYFIADVVGTYTISLMVNNSVVNSSTDTVNVVSATPIGGVYLTNTTLSKINSPYTLTKDVQNDWGTTLLIEQGVEVYGNNYKLSTFGGLSIQGSATERVILHSTVITGTSTDSTKPSKLLINYANLYGNSQIKLPGWYNGLDLRNSVIKDSYSTILIWFPKSDVSIERNVFINSGNIEVWGVGDSIVNITNNVFTNWKNTGFEEALISDDSSSGTGVLIISKNSFLSTNLTALGLYKYGADSMVATNNYFGTVDTAIIDSMIFDKNDDLNSGGYITYTPFLTQPDVNTPDITPYLQ